MTYPEGTITCQPYEQQILLISPEYHFDGPVRVAGKVRLCGLRGWLRDRNPELLALMDSVASDVTNNNPGSTRPAAVTVSADNGSTAQDNSCQSRTTTM